MDIILNPQGEPHPLVQEGHLPLAAWPVSGRVIAQKVFQTEWCQSCRCHGEHQLSQPIPVSGDSGVAGVHAKRQADPVSAPLNVILGKSSTEQSILLDQQFL